jgi:uncharacterized protein (TIGR00296 family)
MYTLEEGKLAVFLARRTMEAWVRGKKDCKPPSKLPESFHRESGVFVTLNTYPGRELRGCIGYPEPVMPLIEAISDSSRSASTRDPRFPPVTARELDKIVVEVSLLTPPELITVKSPKEYLDAIKIGRDGLIADNGILRGLLLPQVPIEWNWNVHEFLDHTCNKAGLPMDAWTDKDTRIYRFTAEIFDEVKPGGEIVARPLSETQEPERKGPTVPANRK